MIEIGKRANLSAGDKTEAGIYLIDKKGNQVLLPNKYVPKGIKPGELIEVFIYKDSEDRPIATTLVPLIECNSFAYLKVNQETDFGAFMDWGMEKDLLVPLKEQWEKMQEGKSYVVHMYLDEITNRLVGSSKVKKFLNNDGISLSLGEEINALIFEDTPLGYLAIVNQTYKGLIYHNEIYERLSVGQELQAFVKKIKENGELDLSLQKIGFKHVDDQTAVLINLLKQNKGFLNLNDNSSPGEIQARLKMSKKVFKKAVGILYRQKKIRLADNGIHLV